MKKFFDYEYNPVLFVLWSWGYSARNVSKAWIQHWKGLDRV